jgi:hypothetical protein
MDGSHPTLADKRMSAIRKEGTLEVDSIEFDGGELRMSEGTPTSFADPTERDRAVTKLITPRLNAMSGEVQPEVEA